MLYNTMFKTIQLFRFVMNSIANFRQSILKTVSLTKFQKKSCIYYCWLSRVPAFWEIIFVRNSFLSSVVLEKS